MMTAYDQCACCGSHDVRDTSADERYPERVRIYCYGCYDGAPDGGNRMASTAEEWSEMQREDAAEMGRRSPVAVAAALERGCVRAMIDLDLEPERLPACSSRSYADWADAQAWGSRKMAAAGRDIDLRLRWVLRDERGTVIAGSVERDERAACEDMLAQVAADCGLAEIWIEVVSRSGSPRHPRTPTAPAIGSTSSATSRACVRVVARADGPARPRPGRAAGAGRRARMETLMAERRRIETWDRAERARLLADHTVARQARQSALAERCAAIGHATPTPVKMVIGWVDVCSLCGTTMKDDR